MKSIKIYLFINRNFFNIFIHFLKVFISKKKYFLLLNQYILSKQKQKKPLLIQNKEITN